MDSPNTILSAQVNDMILPVSFLSVDGGGVHFAAPLNDPCELVLKAESKYLKNTIQCRVYIEAAVFMSGSK